MGKNFQNIYSEPFVGTFYLTSNIAEADNLKLEKLDIGEKGAVSTLFNNYSFDTVVLAAAQLYSKSKKNDFYKINVEGVKNVIESMKKNGTRRIIYISTATLELKNNLWGDYGKTKYIAENLIKNSGLDYIILRPDGIYGKYEKEGIGKLIRLVKKHYFFPLIGGGKNMLSPIRAEDVCHIIIKCLATQNHDNKTYLLCGGEKISFKELVLKISRHFNKKVYFIYVPGFLFNLVVRFIPFFDKDQMRRAANTRAFECASAEKEFDYKFKKVDFSY